MKKTFFVAACFIQTLCFGKYYSQCGQDRYVNETFFKNKLNGVFIDIGAHDGICLSNTYFFENELDWDGICIEPNPITFAKLQASRKAICISGCIANENIKGAEFLQITGPLSYYSGIVNKYEPLHLKRVEGELALCGGTKEIIKVDCYNLNDLLEQYEIAHVDFLSLDTEGGELEILKSINYDKIKIDVIAVENNYGDPGFKIFMKSKGYVLSKNLVQDHIFFHKDFCAN